MDEDSAKVLRAYAGLKLRKSRKDGVYNVCKAWEDQYKCGQEKGRQEERKNFALRLFDLGDSIEKISAVVEESEETVTDWLREAGKVR